MATLIPARPIPPGRLIRREIDERGWTQKVLAEIMGRPEQAITEIIQGTKQITPETARELGAAFDTSAEVWLNLETRYRLALEMHEPSERTDRIARKGRLYSLVPIRELIKRGWLKATDDIADLERQVRELLGVQSLDAIAMPAVRFRRARVREVDTIVQLAWLRRAEILAREQQGMPPFDRPRLKAGLPSLLDLATRSAYVERVPQAVKELGIHFVIVPQLDRTYIDGAAFWVDDQPAIAMTVRYDRVDYFWMTLMHEIAHIVEDHRDVYLDDFGDEDDTAADEGESAEERRANRMAHDWLLEPGAFAAFVERERPEFNPTAIKQFAATQGRSAGIVLGRLYHDGLLGYDRHRFLLGKVRSHLQPWIDVAEARHPATHHAREEMNASAPAIPPLPSAVWGRIAQLAGHSFETKTGKPFTYTMVGNSVRLDRTQRLIGQGNFSRAWQLMPLAGPASLRDVVQGAAYVWAILADPRITGVTRR